MSLVNVIMTHDRAFIATDTLAMQSDLVSVVGRVLGGAVKTPKILALPHARCAIAYRANGIEVSDCVLHSLLHDFESTDSGMRDLPELLHSCVTAAAKRSGYASLAEVPETSELWATQLTLVGWSDTEQCMALLFTWYSEGKQRVSRVFGERGRMTQILSSGGCYNDMPPSPEEMARATRQVVEAAREAGAPEVAGVGGTLVVSEITRDAVNLRKCGELGFPPYAKTAHIRNNEASIALQVAGVPQVQTGGIAPNAVAPIATAVQSGSTNVYLTDTTIASTTIDSQGFPIYVSFSVDCDGSYSGDKATFSVKVNGSTVYTKDITATRDSSQPGAPWSVKGALVQTVISSPGTGTKTIAVTAIGTHATYGVTVNNGNLYCEGKLR